MPVAASEDAKRLVRRLLCISFSLSCLWTLSPLPTVVAMLRVRKTTALLLAWVLVVTALLFYRELSNTTKCLVQESHTSARDRHSAKLPLEGSASGSGDVDGSRIPHKLCILVPFRDRFEELLEFLPYMGAFLRTQDVAYTIHVINQADGLRFNRASLINAGFLHVRSHQPDCDYLSLHDVDLLPNNHDLSYSYPESGPRHLSPPGLHPKYDYANFLGGILLIRTDHFEKVRGMSNNFWGWGLEDDEFLRRLWESGLNISRPEGITTGRSDTFRHLHSARRRPRDYEKCYNQRDMTRRRDRDTGFDTLAYKVVDGPRLLEVDGVIPPTVVLSVELECNRTKTPYCDCTDAPATEAPVRPVDGKDNIMPRLKRKKKKSS